MKIGSKAIIVNNGKYLLQLRDNKKNILAANRWGFFGGSLLNRKETPESCMKRELKEELSIKCDFLMKIYECLHTPSGHYIHFFYIKPNKKITKDKLNEGQDFGWFRQDQIKKLKIAGDVEVFFDYFLNYNVSKI